MSALGAAHMQVSFSKVRAITRIATPENEETLLSYALSDVIRQY